MFAGKRSVAITVLSATLISFPWSALASPRRQSQGTLKGIVRLQDKQTPLHDVIVTIIELRRSVETDESGQYEFRALASGSYNVLAHLEGFPDSVQSVTVRAGETSVLDFELRLSGPREQVTVTATGNEQTTFESFQSVTSLDPIELSERNPISIGEVLENQAGVAKRSFGPGSARPVIRGFDGDRVLVLQDGVGLGSLGSQSGDHGEPLDVLAMERVEIVRGPATLLYGSNAIGGVVNAVTGHDFAHKGVRGYVTLGGGSANSHALGSAGIEYGFSNWMLWGSGSGQRTSDYDTPLGEVVNSRTENRNGIGGFGWYGDKSFFSASYGYDHRRYGVPFAALFEGGEGGGEDEAGAEDERIDVAMRRHNLRLNGGFRDLGMFIDAFRLTLDLSDYRHRELENDTPATLFNNDQFSYRGVFDQRKGGVLSGRMGFWGLVRKYETIGAEALTPPVDQNAFAAFVLEELDFKRASLQFGGRIERNSYDADGLRDRSFTGFSGAAGIRVNLWEGGLAVANYTHSYRAPSLEELYNNGPHIGNLAFEIGNANLTRESNDGVDLSIRHSSTRFRAEANLYYYSIKDFVFLAPTGRRVEGLIEAEYLQGNSRFFGTEISTDFALHRNLWINFGLDAVDAELKDSDLSLPRIPPLRGRAGFEFRYRGLNIRPEAIIADRQDNIFPTETPTAGYTVFNVVSSYTLPKQHFAHIFSVSAFNLGDRLYRNHLSLIKDLAPEIGRGVRFSYTLRFF